MNEIWLLTVGEYDDHTVLGVVLGDEHTARERAIELTAERASAQFPHNHASDMIKVSIEKAEVL